MLGGHETFVKEIRWFSGGAIVESVETCATGLLEHTDPIRQYDLAPTYRIQAEDIPALNDTDHKNWI